MGGSASSNCAWCVLVWFFKPFLGGFFVGMVGGGWDWDWDWELTSAHCIGGFFLEREGGRGVLCR